MRIFRKKHIIILIILVLAVVLAIVGVILYRGSQKRNGNDFAFENMPGGGMSFTVTENMTAASGVTNVGMTEERFEVENLAAELEIEEVYITSEDIVTEGTAVLKLSEESVAEARKELEQTLRETELAYRAGAIEYEQNKITAEYERESKKLDGKQAKAVYDETISGLQDSVDKAAEELAEANEDIAEYQSYVNNDTYRSYFKVDEYQAVYDETLEALIDKMDEWGVSWPQVTGQGNSGGSGSTASAGTASAGNTSSAGEESSEDETVSGNNSVQTTAKNTSPSSDQIQVLSSLYKVLEKHLNNLDEAVSDYEDALVNASFELQTLELKLPELEKALTEAEKNYESRVLQAKLTYETSLANADSADSDYETAIEQAETDYETLKNDWEDAKENLELFESSVGDGYYHASGSGTVLRTMVRAGQSLMPESTIFLYSNPQEMTVTVSVNQANIAGVALEDSVYVQFSEYGGFEGVVTEINPVSSSDSRTSVAYSVTVKLNGDTAEIPANESATVVFGMEEETIRNMIAAGNGGRAE